jgi:hypothetical protein
VDTACDNTDLFTAPVVLGHEAEHAYQDLLARNHARSLGFWLGLSKSYEEQAVEIERIIFEELYPSERPPR